MKTILKKTITGFIILSMVITAIPVGSVGLNGSIGEEEIYGYERRLQSVLSAKLDEIKQKYNVSSLRISAIKEARDFAGNEFLVVEFNPTGYMIFNEEYGVFVESSASSPSPYLTSTGNLYYCGPMFYYAEDENGNAVHTLETDEIIPASDISLCAESCNEKYSKIGEEANTMVLDYLEGKYRQRAFVDVATELRGSSASTMATQSNEVYLSLYFSGMNQCGFYCPPGSSGICGYISLALVISYKEYCNSASNYMDDSFWTDSTCRNLKDGTDSFAWYLRSNHGTQNATRSTEIKEASQSYFANRGVGVSHDSRWSPFFTKGTINDSIDANNPVIAFGDIEEVGGETVANHAVVIYGYKIESGLFGETTYTAHFGEDSRNSVEILTIFNSIYILG